METIRSGKAPAAFHMRRDFYLLQRLSSIPILHLYRFAYPSLTYGHFIARRRVPWTESLDVAKRPTGGGVTYHVSDYAYSFFLPASHPNFSLKSCENYRLVGQLVASVVYLLTGKRPTLAEKGDVGYPTCCSQQIMQGDLLVKGKKIGGGAQRKTKRGFLHQGSVFLGDSSYYFGASRSLLGPLGKSELERAKTHFEKCLTEVFTRWQSGASNREWLLDCPPT